VLTPSATVNNINPKSNKKIRYTKISDRTYATLFTSFSWLWKKKMIDKYPKNGTIAKRKNIDIPLKSLYNVLIGEISPT
jgi:hypothetical protein